MVKFSIHHFAKGCGQSARDEMKALLDVRNKVASEKYLGMLSNVGALTNGTFKYIKDRVWKRIQGGRRSSYLGRGKKF